MPRRTTTKMKISMRSQYRLSSYQPLYRADLV